ncbi:MAG: xanthine dehydrogenase family protein subunit M [Desulfobacterota bacterium]|jgi:xanthine dehydrogenase YagS FAD-binding subunit|nr:xanthine dehydrogenase family protein subunit M [Thermodesulfobacteriota bacterium]
MRPFIHFNARSVKEACGLLAEYGGRALLNAGGTDLLGTLKADNLFEFPEALVNIKPISGLDKIVESRGTLRIGALAKLSAIVNSPLLNERYPVLAEAARTVATPQIRNAATIGGNLCQDVRCWYYRYPRHIGGPILCARKGKAPCLAVKGDNRYHALMGAKKCFAVCPSDTAVALSALDGQITTAGPEGERKIVVTDFYNPMGNSLKRGELVTGVEVPSVADQSKQVFLKFTLRKPVDFAIVSVATVITLNNGVCTHARIALGAVAAGPVRATKAEKMLVGKLVDEQAAADAAEAALADAKPLSMNAYKIEIAKTLVKRAILQSRQ